MPVHREKEARPVRTSRRETPGLTRRDGERPIVTQIKSTRSEKKSEQEKKVARPESRKKPEAALVRDDKVKKQVAVKGQRNRTRTRTLSPTEVKQMTKERIARDYGAAAAAAMVPTKAEAIPTPRTSDHEEVEDYEDDFEDYESDFEEESEEETPEPKKTPERKIETPQPIVKTENQKREIEEIKKAIKMENELTKSRVNTPDLPEPEVSVTPILDFSKARRKSEASKAAEKARRRGRDLLSMITLDAITYSFLDIPSIPYEVYMKMYGKSNTKQVHVQTNEDDVNEETQTTPIETQNKWVQKPTDALGEKKYRLTKEEQLGVGGDDLTQPETVLTVMDTTRLNEFLEWASDILIAALQKSGNSLGADKLPNQSKDMHFSDGFVIPNVSDLPFVEGKSVTVVSYIPEDINTLVTVHADPKLSFGESIICVWNINDLSKPVKLLTASNRVTAVCAVVQGLVFAGLADGTVCLWDLKESSALHHGAADSAWVLRSPTYSTAQLPNCHISPVVSVHDLREGSETHTGDFTPVQVCSLEEKGVVIIWSVVQGRNLSTDQDLGLAHWGKVKLVKSSTFSVISTLGKEIPLYVTCNALAVEQSGDVELYVTNSLGSVSHLSRYGTSMKPKTYKASDLAETTCLEICPFNPNYFLTGCSDGSIRNQQLPLISLNANTADDSSQASIVSLAWLYVRPFVFFALDSMSRIHIWDLGLSDMYPEVTLNLARKKVTSMKLIQSSDAKQRPHFVLGTTDGKIELHRLKDDYSNRPAAEIQKDVKKFLKYVSIL